MTDEDDTYLAPSTENTTAPDPLAAQHHYWDVEEHGSKKLLGAKGIASDPRLRRWLSPWKLLRAPLKRHTHSQAIPTNGMTNKQAHQLWSPGQTGHGMTNQSAGSLLAQRLRRYASTPHAWIQIQTSHPRRTPLKAGSKARCATRPHSRWHTWL